MRLRLPGVVPVEVWDLEIQGRPLQAWRHSPTFPDRLAETVQRIRGRPPGHWSAAAREAARNIRHVHLCGGAAKAALAAAISVTGLGCSVAGEPRFAAALAGLRLGDACVDIGQTSVKIATGARRLCIDRDLVLAPMRDGVTASTLALARASTIRSLGVALAAMDLFGDVVLAVPCAVSPEGVPGPCTYCWRDGDERLFGDLARAGGLSPERLSVLNDAELAAVAARGDGQVPDGGTVLVLTVGFGVGGALLAPEEAS